MRAHRVGFVILAATVCSAALANAPAQEPGRRPLMLQDYYELESASSPAISPDGARVAFVRTIRIEEENRSHSEVWLAASDGASAPLRLTHPGESSSNPRWSPDGTLLAFRSRRRMPGQEPGQVNPVWFLRMDGTGGEAFQIEGVNRMPEFSPDGKWIAFARPTPPVVAERDSPGELERRIQERFEGRIYDWMNYRRDGSGYLPDPRDPSATPPSEIYLVPAGGGEPVQLTELGVDARSITWAPDASSLAFVADAHQRDEHIYPRADLWVVDLDGDVTRLTDDGFNNRAPIWSPDGGWIAFGRTLGTDQVIASGQRHGSPVDLYRIPSAGGEPENLTASWDLRPSAAAWSPDGRYLYFTDGIGGQRHLFRLAVENGTVEQMTEGRRRLGSFSFSAALDRLAYTAGDSTHPAEIHCADLDVETSSGNAASLSGERRLSGLNDALLSEVELSEAERFVFPSADGTEIEGWILPPYGYARDGGPYPLILSIHGGPHSAYGESFSFQWQLWAAQGYFVLYTNPRGSTGYGEDFLWSTWGGWGILDTEDVLAGVDYAVEHYPVDARRLGVTGGSYGGFLTNWIIAQTDRFAAAVSRSSISNWISDYGTADIPNTKETEFGGPPWVPEARALLEELSPVRYVAEVVTPTLFIHGELDLRTPIEQAEQMYMSLQKLRVPAKFIRYPDSYHGGWTHWRNVHRYHSELQWWKRWLE